MIQRNCLHCCTRRLQVITQRRAHIGEQIMNSTHLIGLSAVGVLTGLATANVSFFNDLTSGAGLAPDLMESDSLDANRAIAYGMSGAQFGTALGGNEGRNYIRTVDSDYNSASFVAEVTMDYSGGIPGFMGFGGGNVGTFGTPDWDVADTVWIEQSFAGGTLFTYDHLGAGPNLMGGAGFATASTIVRLQMSFDADAMTITYAIDNDYVGGAFVADETLAALDISHLFTDGEEARIYVGGGGGVTLSDFSVSVVPAPGALGLLGAGGLLAMKRRR